MSFIVRLLIVEDDETEQSSWRNAIEMHNGQGEELGFEISADYAKSLLEASDIIAKRDFDAAVVDIRLEQQGINGPNTDGNAVVEKLLESELAVVAVFTGEAAQVKIPEWAIPLVQTFRKGADEGEGTPAVMSWLIRHAPMVQPIRRAELRIKKEMVQLFTRSIWPRWSQWTSTQENDEEKVYLELALSRHLASHVHAVLLEDSKQRVHPEEWYFIPPIRDGIRTGDILKNAAGEYEIVITPRCDLAIAGKSETIQLAQCKVVSDEWNTRCKKIADNKIKHDTENDPKKKNELIKTVTDAENSLRNYTQHSGNKANFHFLPQVKLPNGTSLGPFMVQFDKIRSVNSAPKSEIDALLCCRVASLTPEFLPSLVERLGGFFSRIGTPDYSHLG